MSLNEKLFQEHLINTIILNEQYIKFIIESFKISSVSKCRNYALIDNKVFDIENKVFLEESNLLSESANWDDALLMLEADKPKRSAATWWANLAQNVVSVGSVFANVAFPGSGLAIEVANGLVYLLRGYYSGSDEELKNSLYLNGIITIAFSLLGAGFGGGFAVGLKALIGSAKVASPVVLKALVWLSGNIARVFFRLINWVLGGAPRWALRQIAKLFPKLKPAKGVSAATANAQVSENIANVLRGIQKRLTDYINRLVAKGSQEALTTGSEVAAKQAAKALGKLAGKEGFEAFIKTGANVAPKIAAGKAIGLLAKLGIKKGSTISIKGVKYTIGNISATLGGGVTLINKKTGATFMVSPAIVVNAFLRSKGFMGFARRIFSNPSLNALGARFLGGFLFSKSGAIEDVDIEAIPEMPMDTDSVDFDLDIDLNFEVAGYEGDTENYTVKNEVMAVQAALEKLGEALGSTGVDGKYGPITKTALNNVEKSVGMPETPASITAKSVVSVIMALIQANKLSDAKTLANDAITDSEVLNNVNTVLNSNADEATKIEQLKGVTSGKAPATSGSGNPVSNAVSSLFNFGGLVSEGTFSENYSKLFGL